MAQTPGNDIVNATKDAIDTAGERGKVAFEAAKDAAQDLSATARESAENIINAVTGQEPRKKKRHTGAWIVGGLAAAVGIGIGVVIFRAVTLADEHWIGIEDEFSGN